MQLVEGPAATKSLEALVQQWDGFPRDEKVVWVPSYPKILPADLSVTRQVREEVGKFLTSCLVDEERVEEIELVVTEACANAVKYGDEQQGGFYVGAWKAGGSSLEVAVANSWRKDPGKLWMNRGLPAQLATSGRGIFLLRELCGEENVTYHLGPGLTVVHLRCHL